MEPNPQARRLMVETLALNGISHIVDVVPVALGGAEAFGVLDQTEAEFHNLGGVSVIVAEEGTEGALPIRTGDDVLGGRAVDFIKLDVEGTELQVLAGLKATIDYFRPIMSIEVMEKSQPEFALWLGNNRYRVERTYCMYRGIRTYICVPD